MKKIILLSFLFIPIFGYQLLTGFAAPASAPSGSLLPVWGIFPTYFSNISTPANPTIINPVIIGFNPPPSLSPIHIPGATLITNYLKTLGSLWGGRVLNGFDATGNIVSSTMDSLVKGFLSGKMAWTDAAVIWFDALSNITSSQEVGYWKGMFPSGIGYTNGHVTVGGSIRLYGNASSKNATLANHLVPLGQIQAQISSLQSAITP